MKLFTHFFSRTALMLMSLILVSLALNQYAQAAPAACTYTFPNGTAHSAAGTHYNSGFRVNASEASCTWTAKSNSSWIKINNGGSYQGSVSVLFELETNPGGARNGTISVAGTTYYIHQGAKCEYALARTSQDIGKAGGEFSVYVTATSLCHWVAISKVSWIKNKNFPAFENSDAAVFSIDENTGPARTGTVEIAGKTFTVNQAGTCSFAVSPTSQSVPSGGGIYPINVTTTAGCYWTAASDSGAWAKITSAANGTGNGTVYYTVSPNYGVARTAYIIVANKQITVSQAAGQPPPSPTLSAVNPGFVVAGAAPMPLTLTGTNFTIGSQARWNGEERQTSFVSSTQLKVTLYSTDLKNAATNKVTVYESSTNKTSNAQNFLVLSPQASVSAASYKGEDIAPDSIVAAFGVKLADATAIAKTVPLPASLAGTTVRVIDSKNLERLAPLFFVSAGQVNYLMPADMPLGPATVVITSESGNLSVGYINVVKVAPGIFTAAANGAGYPSAQLLRIKANGQQVYEPIARYDQEDQKFFAVPINLTIPGEQVFLVLYGTGMRYHGGLNGVSLKIGGTSVGPSYLGISGLTGLDQLNAALPNSLSGRGEVELSLSVDGKATNIVKLAFK